MRLLPPDSEHGWTPYIWLVYAAFYVASPFVFGASPLGWVVQGLGLAAFVPLYFRGYWVSGAARLPIIVAIAALGVSLTPVNPGAVMFFVYAAAFVGEARTGRAAGAWIGGVTLAGVATVTAVGIAAGWFPTWWRVSMVAGVAVFAPLIGFVNLHYAELRRRDASLKLAQHEVARLAALAERDRIAHDLHDLLGHTLSVIVLKADLASKLLGRDPARAAQEVADVERISRDALGEVRKAVYGYQDATLSDEIARARGVLHAAGVRMEVEAPLVPAQGRLDVVPAATEHALSLALREGVTNVLRHARATCCRVSLSQAGASLRLVIEDDGVGGEVTEGSGLMGMRARLEAVGGSIERDGRAGTRLVLSVPVGAPAS